MACAFSQVYVIMNRWRLMQNQHVLDQMKADYAKEVKALDRKYAALASPLYQQRFLITSGNKTEICEEKCEPVSQEDGSLQRGHGDDHKEEDDVVELDQSIQESNDVGVPGFWLNVLKNVKQIAMIIEKHDEPILMHLTDLKIIHNQDNMGFNIEFFFSENEYFTNSLLTKEYEVDFDANDVDSFSFEGPYITRSCGCSIDWKEDKDVTTRSVRINKIAKYHFCKPSEKIRRASFFNFFAPLNATIEKKMMNESMIHDVMLDFKIGEIISELIVPQAFLYAIDRSNRVGYIDAIQRVIHQNIDIEDASYVDEADEDASYVDEADKHYLKNEDENRGVDEDIGFDDESIE